jgi:hypothetical protein
VSRAAAEGGDVPAPTTRTRVPGAPRLAAGLAFAAAVLAWHACFARFYPNARGAVGNDYALQLPRLLAGAYWHAVNGLDAVPWYTPAFCGGVPLVADPQSIYYSLPQVLSIELGPLAGVYASVVVFAALGLAGMALLLRRCFGSSREAALIGAVVFQFNGFFAYRMAAGHLTFHSFMLLPLIAWLTLRPARGAGEQLAHAGAAGLALGYGFASGGVHVLPVVVAGVIAIGLLHALQCGANGSGFALRIAAAGAAGVAVAAFKVVPALAYLGNFPRDYYRLPGADTFGASLWTAFVGLFVQRDFGVSPPAWANVEWRTGPLAFEHGVTLVPLAILAAGAISAVIRAPRSSWAQRPRPRAATVARIALLVALLTAPIALNTYESRWNDLLKHMPVIRDSSFLVQWYALYIPLVALAAGLAFDRLPLRTGWSRAALAAAACGAVVASNALFPHPWVQDEFYSPRDIDWAWQQLQRTGKPPPVREIVAWDVAAMNDALVSGASQLRCREPMFGYNLERFPKTRLHPGPTGPPVDGAFNLNDPSCYVYPSENGCHPGDAFSASDESAFESFRSYSAFARAAPPRQRVANFVSLLALGACALGAGITGRR